MTEPHADFWHSRDLRVLKTVVNAIDKNAEPVEAWDIAASTGMDVEDVERSMFALHRGGYVVAQISKSWGSDSVDSVKDITEKAYRAVGAWPDAETMADRLVAALEHVAENTDDEDTRTRTRKILEGFGGSGRQIAVGVATALTAGAIQ